MVRVRILSKKEKEKKFSALAKKNSSNFINEDLQLRRE
jgi:hypothetical protein